MHEAAWMKISVIATKELDAGLQQRWSQLQASQPLLASPYFSPEFTLAVGLARPDVRVAVLEDEGQVAGFFPFQQRWGIGHPVGGRLSDHHGVVAEPWFDWNWYELLRACRLGYWQFDHLAASQRPPGCTKRAESPVLDLAHGWDAWRQRLLDGGARRIGELPRKARKLEREVGPLRFEANSRDLQLLATVMRLKSQQCHRTGALDCFAPPWTRALLERIAVTDDAQFGGRLSVLYAGDTLVAAHFGMRSQQVWHWWFPVYSHAHAAYSPGALLLERVAQAAAEGGHAMLDLGKGDEAYKASFADSALPLVEGCVGRVAPVTYLRAARKHMGHWLRTSPAARPVRPLLRRLRGGSIAAGAVAGLLPLLAGLDPA
jgi:CelD/BcsL family acetyltransferase involved in cellulose biosynthesis